MSKFNDEEYPVKVGDKVVHVKDLSMIGTITHIDKNLPHPTTCNILWDSEDQNDPKDLDIQWTNKVIKIA